MGSLTVKCPIQCLYKFLVPPRPSRIHSKTTLHLALFYLRAPHPLQSIPPLLLALLLLLLLLTLTPSDYLSSSYIYGMLAVSPISFHFFSLSFTLVSLLFLLLQKLGCLILTMMERSSPLVKIFFVRTEVAVVGVSCLLSTTIFLYPCCLLRHLLRFLLSV